jgi:hypothetical protein
MAVEAEKRSWRSGASPAADLEELRMHVEFWPDHLSGELEARVEVELGEPVRTYISAKCEDLDLDDEEAPWPYAEMIAMLRQALAFCGVVGRMSFDTSWLEGEEYEGATATIARLSEEERTITAEDVPRARQAIADAARRESEGFTMLMKTMQEEGLRRGLNKEERGKMTLGEFMEAPRRRAARSSPRSNTLKRSPSDASPGAGAYSFSPSSALP